ncbi:MAG: hypothetical protein Q7S40_33445 [Opitutaceae bacterium]|nr:hypothetical protein [Opitutaceae bacterium]
MTTQARAALQRKMVICERKAVILERIHDELRAARPSARMTRQIEKNRKVVAELLDTLHTTREQLAGNDAPPLRQPANAPAGK